MPVGHGDLAGEDGGGVSEAVIKDFEQILGPRDGNFIAHPVVEDEMSRLDRARERIGSDISTEILVNRTVHVIIVNINPPKPSKKPK